MTNPIILIPARMASERLPGKPLADIGGEPMIVHVWRRAIEANIGPVVVAADSSEIVEAVLRAGGEAVKTNGLHQSGSDRIFEAVNFIDPQHVHDIIINVQGDLPTISPRAICAVLAPLLNESRADISTLCAVVTREEEKDDPNVVKVVGAEIGVSRLRALYFSRSRAPFGEGPLYHHIGLYAYRREALERFVFLKPSPLERREKLEQLRALEAGMRIDVEVVDEVPLGVDTEHDLERAREMIYHAGIMRLRS